MSYVCLSFIYWQLEKPNFETRKNDFRFCKQINKPQLNNPTQLSKISDRAIVPLSYTYAHPQLADKRLFNEMRELGALEIKNIKESSAPKIKMINLRNVITLPLCLLAHLLLA